VASHIVSDERLGEPETNRELFDRLAQHGWLSVELAATTLSYVGYPTDIAVSAGYST
jgi:uncharacterized protein YutE (UPF0331/DUF86 family)